MSNYIDATLPLPNPGDWISRSGAADALGVSRETVGRMVTHGQLTAYRPLGRQATAMYWRAEVMQLVKAREIANRRRQVIEKQIDALVEGL